MTVEGVDYSTSRPSPSGLYAAGKRFVVRYGGPGSQNKQLTMSEVRALTAAGLSIVANAEGTTGGLKGGRAAGVAWASSAEARFASCGMPSNRPIYLSADWDVQAGEWPAVANALRGAAEVLGSSRVGIYGGRNAISWAKRDRVALWFWQTYAWSGGSWVSGVHLQQYRNGVQVAGGDCDLNRAMVADYGQWGQTRPVPVPEVVTTHAKGSGMYWTATQVPVGAVDALGNPVVNNTRMILTPKGPVALLYGEILDLWNDQPKLFQPMTWPRLNLVANAYRPTPIDTKQLAADLAAQYSPQQITAEVILKAMQSPEGHAAFVDILASPEGQAALAAADEYAEDH